MQCYQQHACILFAAPAAQNLPDSTSAGRELKLRMRNFNVMDEITFYYKESAILRTRLNNIKAVYFRLLQTKY